MYRGQLTKWDSAKGFGFIKSNELSQDTFIHISALKHMSRQPKLGDFIHFNIEQDKGKTRATNARIEGAKVSTPFKMSKRYNKPRSNTKLIYLTLVIIIIAFVYQRLDLDVNGKKSQTQFSPITNKSTNKISPLQNFTCDGRQHCSQMNSRAEANFFTAYCPDTKMDGDHDGIPCENDTRF